MGPTFDPNNSQPNYGIHDDSMMRDDEDDEGVLGASLSVRDTATDDEYATPPNQKIPLQDLEEVMSQYDDGIALEDASKLWDDEMLPPLVEDPSKLWDDDNDILPSHAVSDLSADLDDQSHLWDEAAFRREEPSEFDDAEEAGELDTLERNNLSEFGDTEQDTEDVDAAGETDDEDPPAMTQQGGGQRDPMDPRDIITDGRKRAIKLTPRATRTTYVSAAERGPGVEIPPMEDEDESDRPPQSPSPTRAGRPLPSLEPLEHGELHYSDGSDGPVLSLRIENMAKDDPEHDVYKIPMTDIREKPSAGLPSVAQYLIHRSQGQNVKPADYGITTPVRGSTYRTADEIDDDGDGANAAEFDHYDIHQLPSTPLPGRPLAVALDVVDCGLKLLSSVRSSLANLAGVSESFIQARWDKQKGKTGKGVGQGRWRTFLRYYHGRPDAIMEQTGVTLAEGEEKWSNAVAARCYEKFKELFPETHQDILDHLTGLVELERQGQTVHQRNNEWDKFHSKALMLMDEGHEKGFETYMLACGSNIHQDKGLAFIEESECAEGFLSDKMGVKHSDYLGHFISFVQNKVSDTIIEDSREASPSKPAKASRDAGASKPSKSSKPPVPSKSSSVNPPSVNPPSVISLSSEHDEPPSGGLLGRDRYHQARQLLAAAALTVGLSLNVHQFPWSTLATTLAEGSCRLINYPIGVPFPGKEKKSAKPRGITSMPAAYIDTLIKSLSPSQPQKLQFELISEKEKASTATAKLPVIINAAPQPHSKVVRGSRMLADGSVDTLGPLKLHRGHPDVEDNFVGSVDEDAPSAARTRIKKRKQPTAADSDADKLGPRVLRSKGKSKGKGSPAIVISDDEQQDQTESGAQRKRLRRKNTIAASNEAPVAPATSHPEGQATYDTTKRRQVSFSPAETLPPLKKARSVVEVVIPTPRKKVPNAEITPKADVRAPGATTSNTDSSAAASTSRTSSMPEATSMPKAIRKAASNLTAAATAASDPKPAVRGAARSNRSKQSGTASASKDAAPRASSASKDADSRMDAPVVLSTPEESSAVETSKGTDRSAPRPRPSKGAMPKAAANGASKQASKLAKTSSPVASKTNTVPSDPASTAAAKILPVATKTTVALAPSDPLPEAAAKTSPGAAEVRAVPATSNPSTASACVAMSKPTTIVDQCPTATRPESQEQVHGTGVPNTLAAAKKITGERAMPTHPETQETPTHSEAQEQVPSLKASIATSSEVSAATLNVPVLAKEAITVRPIPRRLPPSTTTGSLDTVQPYEGLPRRTALAVPQTGGHTDMQGPENIMVEVMPKGITFTPAFLKVRVTTDHGGTTTDPLAACLK
ncbi:hypothetical protein PTI98_009812 [Pleurotus ostreatus]|nr:hypothetical protein PTI98_009812 [Pleurotus ostreatus]